MKVGRVLVINGALAQRHMVAMATAQSLAAHM